MRFRNWKFALAPVAIAAGGLLLVSNASAGVVGTLLTGSSGTLTVSLNSVIFNNDPVAIGGGNANVANGTSLSFAGCSGALGSPGCLSTQEGVTVNNADLTLTAPSAANANTFLTFASHPNLVYSIHWPPGPGSANTNCATANANGLSCSVFAGSPIVLTYLNGNSFASLAVNGNASDTGLAGLAAGSNYNGGFSVFLTGLLPNGMRPTPQNIQLYFCPSGTCTAADFASGRSITSSESGSFTATLAQQSCPLTQGFWKNHVQAWPATIINLGFASFSTTNAAAVQQLLNIFDTPVRGQANIDLEHQLIAAELNIAAGANPAPIQSVISASIQALALSGGGNVAASSPLGQVMTNLSNSLDMFNQGMLTGACVSTQ